MANKTRMEEIAEMMQRGENKQLDPRESILQNISKGCVIPVISSSFRIEQIFHELAEEEGPNVIERLIALWAKLIKYPMPDISHLARVAQYHFVQRNDDPGARTELLSFLKKFLWNMANTEVEDPALAAGLQSRIEAMRFSDLVEALDYPRFPDGTEDPLRLLARFPLPFYITTSQSDFLERALEAEGKTPRTQICFWSGEMANIHKDHRTITEEFNASSTNPVVYHLYGLEEYPQTLVLSEDDYINFLISIAEDTNTKNPKIPLYLRRAVAESQLILIGFRLSDWDFRVLFRLMMNFRIDGFSPRGMLIQLQDKENGASRTNAIEYLKSYFGRKSFDIEWNNADRFVQELWNEWDDLRQDQS
ncbi:MAG TPA: SIR2 family protein [Anaerolineales bacterium]|nr:SIR2 family protein [Anaerolineales bacterium]